MVMLRLAMATLVIYLAMQAVSIAPFLSKFLQEQMVGRLVLYLLTLAATGLLVWYLPTLRLLHELGLVRDAKAFLWPDIVLSALALSQLSRLWPKVFDWFERQSA